jgi:hypothetical protein
VEKKSDIWRRKGEGFVRVNGGWTGGEYVGEGRNVCERERGGMEKEKRYITKEKV